MNREQAKALLPIITAFAEGKVVQYRPLRSSLIPEPKWADMGDNTAFDKQPEQYRIKPEPLKVWINVFTGNDGKLYSVSHDREDLAILSGRGYSTKVGTYPMEIEL